MIKIPQVLASTLLLLISANLSAQDPGMPGGVEQQDTESSPQEFVPDSQIVPVAEEDTEAGVDTDDAATVPEETDLDTLAVEFALFKQLMNEGVYDEADTVAKRVVGLAIRTSGPQSSEYAKALTNLAIVQHHTEQYEAAQQNFQAAIEIIEEIEDRLNAQLVNPLKGLGASQLQSGRPDLAEQTFRRAVHVTHVNEGPHNLEQLELLESIAEAYLRMGDLDAAKDAQDTIYALNVRKHSIEAIALVPPLMRRGAWQHRAGFIYDERATYRRVIRIIEGTEGKESLELVEPLIRLGKSFFYVDTSGSQPYQEARMSTAEIYFRRAASIAMESPDSDWQVRAQAKLALGDYYMLEGNSQRARPIYVDAWELLSDDEPKLDVRRDQLEINIVLRQQKLPEYFNAADAKAPPRADDPLLQGKIAMTYAISSRGRVEDLKMIEAEPPEFEDMQRSVQREMRARLFRPRFEEAEAVDSPDQLLVHTFFYRQSDLESVRDASKRPGK